MDTRSPLALPLRLATENAFLTSHHSRVPARVLVPSAETLPFPSILRGYMLAGWALDIHDLDPEFPENDRDLRIVCAHHTLTERPIAWAWDEGDVMFRSGHGELTWLAETGLCDDGQYPATLTFWAPHEGGSRHAFAHTLALVVRVCGEDVRIRPLDRSFG